MSLSFLLNVIYYVQSMFSFSSLLKLTSTNQISKHTSSSAHHYTNGRNCNLTPRCWVFNKLKNGKPKALVWEPLIFCRIVGGWQPKNIHQITLDIFFIRRKHNELLETTAEPSVLQNTSLICFPFNLQIWISIKIWLWLWLLTILLIIHECQ